jgi:hypothetical protein
MSHCPAKNSTLASGVIPVFHTHGPKYHFFGYYDKSPMDAGGKRLLCHAVNFDLRLTRKDDVAEIGCWDIQTGQYQKITTTRSFNWQQGAMLQWMPPDYFSRIIFNDFVDGDFRAVIVDMTSGRRRTLSNSIYSVSPTGKHAITPNFRRLFFPRPAYSYTNVADEKWNKAIPKTDGISLIDLEKNISQLIVTTRQMVELNHHETMDSGDNYLEHMIFNPNGTRFAFFHRWKLYDGGIRTRLYTANLDGSGLHCFPDSGFYSHGCWRSNSQLLYWARCTGTVSWFRNSKGMLTILLKPLLKINRMLPASKTVNRVRSRLGAMNYYILTNHTQDMIPLGLKTLSEDGHCSFRPGSGELILTDTYPNARHRQQLLAYNTNSNRLLILGDFHSPPTHANTGYRCDLHPRWSHYGNKVCIDSLHDGTRQMYVYDVSEALAAISPNI